MNINEILSRPVGSEINQQEALFVIAEYIKARTGRIVYPFIETRLGDFNMIRELKLMNKMAFFAIDWLRNNNYYDNEFDQ